MSSIVVCKAQGWRAEREGTLWSPIDVEIITMGWISIQHWFLSSKLSRTRLITPLFLSFSQRRRTCPQFLHNIFYTCICGDWGGLTEFGSSTMIIKSLTGWDAICSNLEISSADVRPSGTFFPLWETTKKTSQLVFKSFIKTHLFTLCSKLRSSVLKLNRKQVSNIGLAKCKV